MEALLLEVMVEGQRFGDATIAHQDEADGVAETVKLRPELAEGFADFAEMMKDAEYFDLTEPLLHSA